MWCWHSNSWGMCIGWKDHDGPHFMELMPHSKKTVAFTVKTGGISGKIFDLWQLRNKNVTVPVLPRFTLEHVPLDGFLDLPSSELGIKQVRFPV